MLLAFLSSPWEIAIVLVVGLLIFGKRLPLIARNMGSSINEFKAGLKETPGDKDNKPDYLGKTAEPEAPKDDNKA